MKFLFMFLLFGQILKANINDPIYLDPPKHAIELELGETKEIEISIVNAGDYEVKDYLLEIQEFVVNDKYQIDPNPLTKNTYSFVNYAKILKGSSIDSILKQSKYVAKIQITAPKDYKHGSGYFVYKLSKKTNKKKQNFVKFVKSLYGYVSVNIKNQGKGLVKIKNNSEKRTVDLLIENYGDKLLNLNGKLIITKNKAIIANFNLLDKKTKQENSLIFPSTSKSMMAIIPSSMKFKKGEKIEATVLITDPKSSFSYSEKVNLKIND